ncbi:MAG: EAL domain-containing protein [Sneathiella sp.]|nr:EAL domain-containing protein [Sneathiella sp.]
MNVLIIDDDEVDYLIATKQLEVAFPDEPLSIDWIRNSNNVDYVSLFSHYDVCLIEQLLGNHLGLEIIQNMHRAGCMVPMILLTGEDNRKVDLQAAGHGAADYLVKDDISPTLLNRSIRFAIAQKKHERKLIDLAYKDGLTGIANRKKFDEYMEMSLSTSSRSHAPLGLILIDLDDFKQVNDTYGHLTGDMLLQQVAQRLLEAVRSTDLVARLGGDEFAIATTQLGNAKDMELILKKISEIFLTPFQLGDVALIATASVGATLKQSGECLTFQELFRRADLSLYSAKFRGKNMTQFYSAQKPAKLKKNVQLSSKIQTALLKDEFTVLYQPKINIAGSTSLCGVEALIRWHPKGKDPVLPGNFIPMAEQSGDIIPIGEWVLDTACAQIRAWKNKHKILIPVAVNVSPVQICRADTVSFIRETLKKYSLSPDVLEIEVTETASYSDPTLLIRHLLQLHQLGCKIAIDDFGVGYSSFQRFIDLPVSSLKIDRSFVEKIGQSTKADATCRSIITLANSLDIPVIAEGVETAQQLRAIKEFDCQRAQGYFIKEPLAADHFMDWLSKYEARHDIQPRSLLH